MATYSLGSFDFITLESLSGAGGAPQLMQTNVEPVQRAGVSDTAFVDLGTKGDVLVMRSVVDVADEAAAHTLIAAYRAVVGTQKLAMVWRDTDYETTHDTKFVCLRITDDQLQVGVTVVGGLNVTNGGTGVLVRALWHLIPVGA